MRRSLAFSFVVDSCCVGWGRGRVRGAAAATRPRNECVVRVRILSWSRACSRGVACIRGRRGAHVASMSRAARCWAACFWLRYCRVLRINDRGQPVAAAVCVWQVQQGIRGSIWAPVIIRFPRRRRPMSCSWQTFTLSFGIHHMMVAGLQQCLRYRKRGLNTVISLLAPRRLTSAFA